MAVGLLEASAMIFWQKPGDFARSSSAERFRDSSFASLSPKA